MDETKKVFYLNGEQSCIGGMCFGISEVTMENGWLRVELSNVTVGEHVESDQWRADLFGNRMDKSDL